MRLAALGALSSGGGEDGDERGKGGEAGATAALFPGRGHN